MSISSSKLCEPLVDADSWGFLGMCDLKYQVQGVEEVHSNWHMEHPVEVVISNSDNQDWLIRVVFILLHWGTKEYDFA